jgi:hypothetical protein
MVRRKSSNSSSDIHASNSMGLCFVNTTAWNLDNGGSNGRNLRPIDVNVEVTLFWYNHRATILCLSVLAPPLSNNTPCWISLIGIWITVVTRFVAVAVAFMVKLSRAKERSVLLLVVAVCVAAGGWGNRVLRKLGT